MKYKILLSLALFCSLLFSQTVNERAEFRKYFENNGVTGSFILFNQNDNSFVTVNGPQTDTAFLPASTFKIFNSLVILETGCLKDEQEIIPWDSIDRARPEWNRDQTLHTAFRSSTVWAYQLLARKVGAQRMQHWISKYGYGNQNMNGGIDQFWLTGELRITPKQQIKLVKDLYFNNLPFSQRSIDIVKKIFVYKKENNYTYSGKTGWGPNNDTTDVGWWVGYIEKGKNVYFFACCVQNYSEHSKNFPACRIEIAESILKELRIL